VYADVGLTGSGGINFAAPVVKQYKIPGLPYYFVIDRSGSVTAKGYWSAVKSAVDS